MGNFINNAPFALVIVFLIIGFVLLIKGADFFVEGSSSVAKRLHVPSIMAIFNGVTKNQFAGTGRRTSFMACLR